MSPESTRPRLSCHDQTTAQEEKLNGLKDASAQTVSNIRSIGARSTTFAEVATAWDTARVVDARSLVDLLGATCAQAPHDLLKTLARGCARGAVPDHTDDSVVGAGVHVVAGIGTVVILHQAWVGDGSEAGVDTDTALAFLHNGSQDES